MNFDAFSRLILTLSLLVLIPFVFGFVGYLLRKKSFDHCNSHQNLMTKINCVFIYFQSGIFIAVIFLHYIPTIRLYHCSMRIDKSQLPFLSCVSFESLVICLCFFFFCLLNNISYAFVQYIYSEKILQKQNKGKFSSCYAKKSPNEEDFWTSSDFILTSSVSSLFKKKNNDRFFQIKNIKNRNPRSLLKPLERQTFLCVVKHGMFTSFVILIETFSRGFCEGLSICLEENAFLLQLLFLTLASYKATLMFIHCKMLGEKAANCHEIAIFLVIHFISVSTGGILGLFINPTSPIVSFPKLLELSVLKGFCGGCILFLSLCEMMAKQRGKIGHFFSIAAMTCGFFFAFVATVL